jgi:hypothetical protein
MTGPKNLIWVKQESKMPVIYNLVIRICNSGAKIGKSKDIG